ncbi:MarR family winged helix-turn-helix transcriptional regulator [Halalkalibacter urbisdiaboli]|uniref:MarR family winged helix-turn-helix transcriptional regulator n=1 Tax=Halalkalibacter urbisdiaboli TaxID=1960589 RepID=UPI000B44E515|nr:MarR family transcriptional regulator [Halalkalibacter urbisdiaboli]
MELTDKHLISSWLSLNNLYLSISNELEEVMQHEHRLSLKEFYVLLYLSEAPHKKLNLQQLQNKVGLSQSAMSRLVARFEAKGCGALQRQACQHDRRNIYTSITEVGERKLEEALVTFHAALEKALLEQNVQAEMKALLLMKKES